MVTKAAMSLVCMTLCLLVPGGCAADQRVRAARPFNELLQERDQAERDFDTMMDVTFRETMSRVKAEYDDYAAHRSAAPPTMNILIISGGGDWGAYAAGFLKGWSKNPSDPRPSFDVVTGVSTGALIAPFAFLGDDASIEKVVHLYRNPQPDWVRRRGLFSVLGGAEAYADIPGLEREMRHALDVDTVRRIAEAGTTGRLLAVSATNVDAGEIRVFDVAKEARNSLETGDLNRIHQVLLASAAIPAAFPPREIDKALYVDGGITGNILFAGPRGFKETHTLVARWRTAYPKVPVPKIRYWIIYNNQVRGSPQTVQPRWGQIALRSINISSHSATLVAIRQIFLQARISQLRYKADVEVRFTSVPDGWSAPKAGLFVKESMNALADLGEKMGADPASWRSEPP
jgi:predicted acylesterase/phospholipase RssA